MLNEKVFSRSYTRVFGSQVKMTEMADRFFDRFYENFLASSDEVAAAFKNTDMAKQRAMLQKSFLYSIHFTADTANAQHMERIAISHNKKHHNIKPELYDLWLDSMMKTLQEFDPEFNDEVELAWRLAFAHGITYMKFMYDK